MPRKTLPASAARRNTLMLAIGAFILTAILAFSYREWSEYRRANIEAAHARDVLDSVNRLMAGLLDAETGQRGFVLTGEAGYLEPYTRAAQLVPVELGNLNGLLGPGAAPVQQLNTLVDQKLAELRQTVDLRRSQGLAPALEVVLSDRGKRAMDQIRSIAADIQRSEESNRIDSSVEGERAAQRALLITIGGSLILLAFLAVGNVSIHRAFVACEEALGDAQKARDSLRTTIASIGDAVIATDTEGRIAFSNKAAQTLLRAREADILGKNLDDVFRIVNEFSRAKIESPVAKVLREGVAAGPANHTLLIAQDGTEIPIDDSVAPIRPEGGPLQGTVLVFRDITESRRAEAASRLLASIVENSDDAIVSKNLNGIVTSWNKGAERIFGYTPEEIVGQPISILAAPDRLNEMPEILERIKRGERIDHYHTLRRTKAGKVIHVSLTISPVRDADGKIIGASKISRDITAQVEAQKQIAEQRERLRVTLNSIGDAVMTTEASGHISYLNPVAEKLTGWTSVEAAGKPLEQVFRILDEGSRRAVENPVGTVLREGRIAGLANHTLLIARDGKEIAIDDSAAPIRNERGELLGVVLIFRDITERKRLEEQRVELLVKDRALASERVLRETEAELARVGRALSVGELATSIAHEINQPLAGVVTNAEAGVRWLSGETPKVQEARESLALIARDANRASAVIRRIREFLKKENPQSTLLDINHVAEEAVALARMELQKRRIDLQTEFASDLSPVRGDRIQLQQVILNLIMNGAEAMASTEGAKELVLRSQKSDSNGVIIAVRDSGVGLLPQDMPRMFDAFFTTKPAGMGMGLSISRTIVESHGGRIWAEVNDGPGLTVQFRLPAETTSQAASSPL
jgi:PAS domain S-box-containing protein